MLTEWQDWIVIGGMGILAAALLHVSVPKNLQYRTDDRSGYSLIAEGVYRRDR